MTYAWKAEKQHKDLIKQIRSAVEFFFGAIVKQMRQESATYYICQSCGSTLIEVPPDECPICKAPPLRYEKMARAGK